MLVLFRFPSVLSPGRLAAIANGPALLLVCAALAAPLDAAPAPAESVAGPADGVFGRVPLLFEKAGDPRLDPSVLYLSRGRGYTVFVTRDALVLRLSSAGAALGQAPTQGDAAGAEVALRLSFPGAERSVPVVGERPAKTRIHYILGSDPEGWSVDNPTFQQVRYRDVWPGIDLVLYDRGGACEYDFVLSPGADPGRIAMRWEGADAVSLDDAGRLVLSTPLGDVVQSAPVLHQDGPGGPVPVTGRFALRDDETLGFEVDAYDPARPLVIDPVLVYASLFGFNHRDFIHGIDADASGAAIVVGETQSTNLPTTPGVIQPTKPNQLGMSDAFVAKFTPQGDALQWCTYLGGSTPSWTINAEDQAYGVDLGPAGTIWICGRTDTTDFPVTANAYKSSVDKIDGFLCELSADGTTLLYSTYFGATHFDSLEAVHVSPDGTVVVTGRGDGTLAAITPNAPQPTHAGGDCGIVVQFSPTHQIDFCTWFGGGSTPSGGTADTWGTDIERGADGRIYVVGWTDASSVPLFTNGFQQGSAGSREIWLARFEPVSGAVEYSTLIGGSKAEAVDSLPSLAIDGAGTVWVASESDSGDYPTTAGAFQPSQNGVLYDDGVLTCVDTNQAGAASLLWSTYFGGGLPDSIHALERDAGGTLWVFGRTLSSDFPMLLAWDEQKNGSSDTFLAGFDPGGNLLSSTYFGGDTYEATTSPAREEGDLAVGQDGDLFIAHTLSPLSAPSTNAGGNIVTPGAFQSTFGDSIADSFVARFAPDAVICQPDLGFAGPGNLTLSICGGDLSSGVYARLRLAGASANSTVVLFLSTSSNPTWVSEIQATLVPLPVLAQLALPLDVNGEFEIYVPGGFGPVSLYLQAVALGQPGQNPFATSNAIRADFKP